MDIHRQARPLPAIAGHLLFPWMLLLTWEFRTVAVEGKELVLSYLEISAPRRREETVQGKKRSLVRFFKGRSQAVGLK